MLLGHLKFMFLLLPGHRTKNNLFSVFSAEEFVAFSCLLVGYGFWGDIMHNVDQGNPDLRILRILCECTFKF